MTEDQKKNLETQLWGIANLLRGKISADDYRDYILGFIFFKYLSEKQYLYANELLVGEDVTEYTEVTDKETLKAIEEESVLKLGYYHTLNEDPCVRVVAKSQVDRLTQSNPNKVIRGVIVHQDQNDEFAEKLLERINTDQDKQSILALAYSRKLKDLNL
jgi:type I restriction-modification system DNA methylase subunit